MKKTYTVPQLTTHGNIEEITQALGSSTARDTLIVNGRTFPNVDGSRDVVG